MNGRRVLLTADAVGGVWQYATDLSLALLRLGWQPSIALIGPAAGAEQRAPLLAGGVPVIDTGLALDWLSEGPEPVRAAGDAIAALARTGGFDLVQLNTPALAASAHFAMPVLAVAHGCGATWWDAAHPAAPMPAAMAWQHDLAARGLARADAVAAPTQAHADTVQRVYRLSRRPACIHNGRRPLVSDTSNTGSAASVLTAGRLWDRIKDTALLDAVAGRIDAPFHAAGPLRSPQGDAVTVAHLRWLGTLSETALADRLAERPVFVSAARFEPFGLAVLEAAAAGCPLVLSDIASFRELWDGAARFVTPGDTAGYVAALRDLLADEGQRLALGDAARTRARAYTPDASATAIVALYDRLLSSHRSDVAA